MKNSNCIIITQKEWLNWLAFGYLRVSPSRISYFDNTESSFDILMSYSVDNVLDEEDAYLLASLVDDYSREELHIKRTPFSNHISIQAVQEFYSLSVKGHNLLKNEMEQSHSIVHYDSEIENLWSEWKNTQFRLRSLDKGNKFLEILGYPRFEVEPEINNENLFSQTLKNYNLRSLHPQLQDRQKRSSFAWLVINQEFKEKIGKSLYLKYYEFRKNNQNLEIQDIAETYRNLEKDFITDDTQSLFDYPSLIAEKYFFDKWHSDHSEPKEHYLASTILVHYYNILESNYEINLLALSKDLTLLDEIYSTKDIAQLIAYFIGRRLNEVYLNFLYIAKNIDEKKLRMFDTNFFSNLKNEKLTLCNVNQVQLQEIIRKVHVIAEEIKLAYNMEVNNVQDSESESDAIEGKDNNLNSPTESQAPRLDSDNSETNNTPIEKLDIANNTTNSDSTQPHSENEKSADSKESEPNTSMIRDENEDSAKPVCSEDYLPDSKNKVVNEDSEDLERSLNTQLNTSGEEYALDSSSKPEAITEPVINSKSDDNNNLEKSEQLDSDHYMDLALSIYSKLIATDSEEKNTGNNFIKKFIENIDTSDKNNFKTSPQGAFFEHFGKLIGDIETYKNIKYSDFKTILDRKLQPASEVQNKLPLPES